MEELRTNDFLSLKARMPLLITEARKRYEFAKENLSDSDLRLLRSQTMGDHRQPQWEVILETSSVDLDACLRVDNLLTRLINGDTKVKEYRRKRLFEDPYKYVAPPSNFNIKRI